ncbi:hypothetical protein COBT_001653 [Conglomerata obtusa]
MLEWKNVIINVPNRNKGVQKKFLTTVNNLSGSCSRGEMLAIMGPSGCGKTNFLGALAGKIQKGSKTQGLITYDGVERNVREWTSKIGFVDQDDQIYEELSVQQTLTFAAKFRLKNATNPIIQTKIDELLTRFNLTHVTHNQMHKLSGGERKRVMLAIELITDPEVIFLDEPTSGLDTLTALTIVKLLKELTKLNKVVVLTIHQPSIEIFSMFDKLLLMTESKTVYFGSASNFESKLLDKGVKRREGISFPDFIAEMVSKENMYNEGQPNHQVLKDMIEESNSQLIHNQTVVCNNESFRNFSFSFSHITQILIRKLLIEHKQKYKFYKSIIIKLVLSTFFAFLVFFGSKNILRNFGMGEFHAKLDKGIKDQLFSVNFSLYYIISSTFLIMIASFKSTVTVFMDNVEVVMREVAIGSYSTASYWIATTIYHCLQSILYPIPFIVFYIIAVGSNVFYIMPLFFLSTAFVGSLYGICFASFFKTKIVKIIVNNVMVIILCVPINMIGVGITAAIIRLQPKVSKLLIYLSYIPAFLVSSHFTTAMSIFNTKFAKKIINTIYFNLEKIEKDVVSNLAILKFGAYIGNCLISPSIICVLFGFLLFSNVMVALLLHSSHYMPQLRMKLGCSSIN